MSKRHPNYEMLPEHMRHGMQLYYDHGIEPGSFLRAVLENDLCGAAGRADHVNQRCLFQYAQFLFNEVSRICWGNPEKVQAWIDRGGMQGLLAKQRAHEDALAEEEA